MALLLAALIAGLGLVGAVWAWWDQRRSDPWLRAYARVRRAATALGLPAGEALPPRSLAAALRARYGDAAATVVRALHELEGLRYAPRDAPSTARAVAARARRLASDAVGALRDLPAPSPAALVAQAPR